MIEKIRVIIAATIIVIDLAVTLLIERIISAILHIVYTPYKLQKYLSKCLYWIFISILRIARRIGSCSEKIKKFVDDAEEEFKDLDF